MNTINCNTIIYRNNICVSVIYIYIFIYITETQNTSEMRQESNINNCNSRTCRELTKNMIDLMANVSIPLHMFIYNYVIILKYILQINLHYLI